MTFKAFFQIFKCNLLVIKEELDHFEEKFAEFIQNFLIKKVRSGTGTIIPDTDPTLPIVPTGSGSTTLVFGKEKKTTFSSGNILSGSP
jgi:hypothetical protein